MNSSTIKVAIPMLVAEVVHCAVGVLWLYAQYPVLLANSRDGCIPRAYYEAARYAGREHPTSLGVNGTIYKGQTSGWEQDHADMLQLKIQSCPSGVA